MHLLAYPQLFNNWALIAMTVCASARHAFTGNWLQAAYWFFAAGLNVIVTLGVR